MIYSINNIILKISDSLKIILINIIFISILFLFSETGVSKVTNIEKILAYNYCDSLEKNLFKGLDKERILKYEYFFNSINKEELNEDLENLRNFPSEVKAICSYQLNNLEFQEFRELIQEYISKN
tara:strand:+ start:29 stop:403 length:375 start_codon:yes stop_codon:yes gene_type:complete